MKKLITIALTLALILSIVAGVTAQAATDHRYGFDISAIPDDQWQQAQCEIHVILTEADGSESTTIIKAKEGYGSPVFLNAKVYDKYTGKALAGQALSTYWVPARLFTETLGLGEIDWDSNRGVATLETYRGTVDLQPDSTYVELPDGTKIEETEYTMGPDSQAIEVVKNRQGRLYVPIRFWLNLCFENAEFDWSRPGVLTVRATRPKAATIPTEVTWTGLRDLGTEIGVLSSAKSLPHIAKAIEETNAELEYGVWLELAVRPADARTTTSVWLAGDYNNGKMGYRIEGLQDYVGSAAGEGTSGYLVLMRGILEDIVSDSSDIDRIMELYTEYDRLNAIFRQNADEHTQAEQNAARKTYKEMQKVYELNSVNAELMSDGYATLRIMPKS